MYVTTFLVNKSDPKVMSSSLQKKKCIIHLKLKTSNFLNLISKNQPNIFSLIFQFLSN